MRMRPLNAQSNLDNAKRALGREVGMLRGFVGIGLGANEIRLYVEDFETLIVKYVQSQYGNYYDGHAIQLIRTPGFRVLPLGAR